VTRAPVEKKTWAALLGGTAAGAGLYLVDALTTAAADPAVFTGLPGPLPFLATTLAPGALAFAASWLARHTNRTDPAARRAAGPGT
jgi:hypothetical protein